MDIMESIRSIRERLGTWDTILEISKKSKNRSKFLEERLRLATSARSLDIMKKLIVDENVDPNSKLDWESIRSSPRDGLNFFDRQVVGTILKHSYFLNFFVGHLLHV